MAGLVPAIHVFAVLRKTWMRGTSPRMTWIHMTAQIPLPMNAT
jgi:hypothetical protein